MKKRNQSLLVILCLIAGLIYPTAETQTVNAAGVPYISASSVHFESKGESKTVCIKNISKKKIKKLTVKSIDLSVATAKKVSKSCFTVTSVCDSGSTTVYANLKLKKKIYGKKKFSYYVSVDVSQTNPQPTNNPEVTAEPTSTPVTTATAAPTNTPAATATVRPTNTPAATATVSPTNTPAATLKPTASPTVTEDPFIIVAPTSAPTAGPTASPSAGTTLPADEAAAYDRIMAMKSEYPEGMPWTDENKYKWVNVTAPNTTYNFGGCAALAAILSDAAFGKETKAVQVMSPDPNTVRIGDILRINNDTHSVVVIGTDGDKFTLVEGNYNDSVHWGRKINKSTPIVYMWTRWQNG